VLKFKELVNEVELNWAGNKLKNCINNPEQNYKNKIKGGNVKVIIITTINSCSALELYKKDTDLHYTEKQLLSTCNKKPSSYHRIIADIVKTELNADLLKNGYKKRLKLYNEISLLHRGMLINSEDKKTDDNEEVFWLDRNDYFL
jgi:hypothetical protein